MKNSKRRKIYKDFMILVTHIPAWRGRAGTGPALAPAHIRFPVLGSLPEQLHEERHPDLG
jgi:hypothetical protein